jgi:hypothetical protein
LPCVCTRQRTIWSLCRAHTHGKAPTWRTPVQPRSWSGCCPRPLSCELAPGRTAKPPGERTATTTARQRIGTRQCNDARQSPPAHGNDHGTTKDRHTAMQRCSAKPPSARQRVHARQRSRRTATFTRTAKKQCARQCELGMAKAFAVLIWLHARQRFRCRLSRCRGHFLPFAVRTPRTAKPLFPVVGQLLAMIKCNPF